MGIKNNDKICGLEYEIAIYDIERNLYKLCKDIAEARATLVEWRDSGTQKKNITVVNANPNVLFKDIFVAKGTVVQHELEVGYKKVNRSWKPIEVHLADGTNKTYYLEVRLSVLRDIRDLNQAVLSKLQKVYEPNAVQVHIPDEIMVSVNKAKANRK